MKNDFQLHLRYMKTLFILFFLIISTYTFAQCDITIIQKGPSIPKRLDDNSRNYNSTSKGRVNYKTNIHAFWMDRNDSTHALESGQVILADSTDLCHRIVEMIHHFKLTEIYMEMGYMGNEVFTALIGSKGQLIDLRPERKTHENSPYLLGKGFNDMLYSPIKNAHVVDFKNRPYWKLVLWVQVRRNELI